MGLGASPNFLPRTPPGVRGSLERDDKFVKGTDVGNKPAGGVRGDTMRLKPCRRGAKLACAAATPVVVVNVGEAFNVAANIDSAWNVGMEHARDSSED